MTNYKDDPPGIELLQSMPTLFENNYWGVSGWGDCDCFTITAMACLKEMGYANVGFVLFAKSKNKFSHIAATFEDETGQTIIFDLTRFFMGASYGDVYPVKQFYTVEW